MNLADDEKDSKGERERFEATFREAYPLSATIAFALNDDGEYAEVEMRMMLAMWQAARADTARVVAEAVAREREACAVICDNGAQFSNTLHQRQGAARCAPLVRARSAQPDAGEKS